MLLIAAASVYNAVYIPFIVSMWSRRIEPLLRARDPRLCCLSGIALLVMSDVVFIQQILLRCYEVVVPASLMLWAGNLTMPFVAVSYILKSRRLIILTGPERERERNLQSLDLKTQFKLILAAYIMGIVVSTLTELLNNKAWWRGDLNFIGQPCFFSFPRTVLLLPVVYRKAKLLRKARDGIELGNELTRGLVIVNLSVVPYFFLLVLQTCDLIQVDTRIQYMLVIGNALLLTDAFIVSRTHWAFPHYRPVQVEVEDETSRRFPDSLALINDTVMDPIFAEYVVRHLCYESYRFLVDASNYERICNDPKTTVKAQYRLFKDIVKRHIEAGSPLEINIPHSAREPIIECMKEFAYIKLLFDARQQMFHDCIIETCRLLDFNLVQNFKKTPEFMRAAARATGQRKSKSDENMTAVLRLV